MGCEEIFGGFMLNLKSLGNRLTTFVGGSMGPWKVISITPVKGEPLPHVERVMIHHPPQDEPKNFHWLLAGVASHVRYVERREKVELDRRQAELGRPEDTRAALIPILKSPAWWELTQEERRTIFEERSHHIGDSLRYLPAIARRLYHSCDLGEPFDFLTWFEYSEFNAQTFEELVHRLRHIEEWNYVEREIDIRLSLE